MTSVVPSCSTRTHAWPNLVILMAPSVVSPDAGPRVARLGQNGAVTDLRIRRATTDDAEALTQLHLDCWDDAYTGLIPQEILDARRVDLDAQVARRRAWLESSSDILLASYGDGLVGFANAGASRD